MPRFQASFLLRSIIAVSAFAAFHAHAAEKYIVTDLGTIGGLGSGATGINDAGQVIGQSQLSPGSYDSHAFLYSSGILQDLGTFGGARSTAMSINNAGQIVGYAETKEGDYVPYVYTNGRMTSLIHPANTPGVTLDRANSINASGQIAGVGYDGSARPLNYIYAKGTATRIFNDTEQVTEFVGSAVGINDTGHVIGTISEFDHVSGDYSDYSYLYANGAMIKLSSTQRFIPTAINNHDQIVGNANTASLYSGGTFTDLGSLGGMFIEAYAINDSAEVVGYAQVPNGDLHGFLYKNGAITDLNKHLVSDLGYTILRANGINNIGQIACTGTVDTKKRHVRALLLTPVSEAPKILVSGPGQIRTTRAQLLIKGRVLKTASYVTWRVGAKGKPRKALGNANWSFRINLNPGANYVIVQAHGNRGDSLPARLTIVRQ